jgi:hypothetical protein
MTVDDDAVRAVRAMAERSLSLEDFDAYVHAPMSDEERASVIELYEWFTRRYPTPMQRLAASRRLPRYLP